jgi:hypothetical protein
MHKTSEIFINIFNFMAKHPDKIHLYEILNALYSKIYI